MPSWLGGASKGPAHLQRGKRAEDIAERFLLREGLTILERNYRCRMGEVDLIANERGTLVFVEVRLRTERVGNDFGGAAASITPAKQHRIIKAAQHYLSQRRELPPCRFDAVLLDSLDTPAPEWIKGAFDAG
ncbi:MAG: YraN family protein [Betaproteobacteria bacterium]|nr:YraN family protein [Betaproteobacteria bacterium]